MDKLLTKYLNSVAVFSPPDDNAARQREEIQVEVSHDKDEDENENKSDNKEEKGDNNSEDESDEDEDDEVEDKEDKEGKDENKEETEEQKNAREKEERRSARVQRKFDKIAAEKKALEVENERLKKQIEAQPKEGLTEEEVERRATEKAKQLKAQEDAEREQREFKKRCDNLQTAALKIDNTIEDKIGDMVEELGVIPFQIINILSDLDHNNGGAVLNYLTDNIDEAEEIYEMTERRMTQKLIRISDKLKADEEAKEKTAKDKKSTTRRNDPPEPLRPITENNKRTNTQLSDNMSMDDFVKLRNAQVEERRKIRGY